MHVQSSPPQGTSPFRPPFQYSLWSMFVLTTLLAIGLGFLVAAPTWLMVVVLLLLSLALPMALTIAVIYGRGRFRTFAIGALFPAGVLIFSMVPLFRGPFYGIFDFGGGGDDLEARVILTAVVAVTGILIAAFGLLALWIRWLVERPQRQRPASPVPPSEAPTDFPPPPAPSERRPD
jgi:hypothetical protein